VRLVVFNLNEQRELFHQDGFTVDGMSRVAHAADEMDTWAVDYRVLQDRSGAWDLLAGLMNREIHAPAPSDVVIFLGLPWGSSEKMPQSFPGRAIGQTPRFFYLQYQLGGRSRSMCGWAAQSNLNRPVRSGPTMRRASFEPYSLDQSVRRLKGKTIAIYSPPELSKAIEEIEGGAHQQEGPRCRMASGVERSGISITF